MWRPLIPKLANRFTVVAPDLPGIGGSAIPPTVWMARSAARIHGLVRSLGIDKAIMVWSRHRPDGGVPQRGTSSRRTRRNWCSWTHSSPGRGVGGHLQQSRDLALRFNGPTAEALVRDASASTLTFANGFAAGRAGLGGPTVDPTTRPLSVRADAGLRNRLSPGFSERRDCGTHAGKPTMPVLSIQRRQGQQPRARSASDAGCGQRPSVVLPNTGHWIMEGPRETVNALMHFLDPHQPPHRYPRHLQRCHDALRPLRWAPKRSVRTNQGSGLPGVSTTVLFGDPSKAASRSCCRFQLTPRYRDTPIRTIARPLSCPAPGSLAGTFAEGI